MALRSNEVAHYLERHPEFFEEHSEMLSTMTIPHPDGGRAIPLVERQILSLRKKNRNLEAKLKDLIAFAEENDGIAERVHRMAISLLRAQSLEALLQSFYFNLREDFSIPHMGLRLWGVADPPKLPEFVVNTTNQSEWSLPHPICGPHNCPGTSLWFPEAMPHLKSFANVPITGERVQGLLVLASEDPQRFYPEMGTVYLKRLGELLSASVSRFIGEK
ncbi:MAG: DUF484 family protein [Burkholderiales bacterium]